MIVWPLGFPTCTTPLKDALNAVHTRHWLIDWSWWALVTNLVFFLLMFSVICSSSSPQTSKGCERTKWSTGASPSRCWGKYCNTRPVPMGFPPTRSCRWHTVHLKDPAWLTSPDKVDLLNRARAEQPVWTPLTIQYGVTVSHESYVRYYVKTEVLGCNGNSLGRGLECPKPQVWTLR